MRKQFSFKPLSTHNDNQSLQTKSDSIGRFRSIIAIRKIQTTSQFLKMKQELALEFPEIPMQFKNQHSKAKIFSTKPQFHSDFPIKEDLSQFSKKIQQTIKTSFKKCQYWNKANQVIYTNELPTVFYFNITITYEEQETYYQFIRRLGNTQKTEQNNSKQFKAKNLLKIVGVFENYDTRPIFTFKIRSFYKMYLQNQIEWNYQNFYDHYPNSLFLDYIDNKKNKLISRSTYQFNTKTELFKLQQQFCGILSIEMITNIQSNFMIENDQEEEDQLETCVKIIQCNRRIKLFKSPLQCIVNRLDNETQNQLLTECEEQHSFTFAQQHPQYFNRHLQFKVPDQNCIAFRFYNNYYEILNGIFEDTHEISNLQDNITMLEFEEPQENQKPKMVQSTQHQQIQPKKLNFESIMKKSKHQPSITQEISPRSDHSQISTMRTPREGQLLPVLMKPQFENNKIKLRTSPPSYDDNISNSNNNQQYSTHHSKTISQTDMVSFNTPRSQRTSLAINLSLRTSMTKNSLKTRTLVVEQFKKSQQKANQLAGLLIQENKYNELVELFNNNPNLRIDERISNGNTYLMLAAQGGNLDICELILSKGASVNLQNLQGDTALHKAFQYGNFSVADLLVSYGAQVMVNDKGKTPWQM